MSAELPKDDRIIYLAVRYRGDEGMFVEGGYNAAYDAILDDNKKRAVLEQALNAIAANGVALFPEDQDWQKLLEETSLGRAGGPNWHRHPVSDG